MRAAGVRTWQVDAVGALVVILLALVAVSGVVGPIMSARSARAELDTALGERQTAAQTLESTRRELARQVERVEAVSHDRSVDLRPASELNAQLSRLAALAYDCGMRLHETRTGASHAGRYLERVPITLTGVGNYPACAAFLERVHGELPDTSVMGFELSGNPARPGDGAEFRFDLAWYAVSAPHTGAE